MTKSEVAEQFIRDQIRSGAMEPGSFIDKAVVCAALGMSRQPVSAALTALGREGLVEIRPQLGSYVARPENRPRQISQEAARDLLAALKDSKVEMERVRRYIYRLDPGDRIVHLEDFDLAIAKVKAAIAKAEGL